ncbi:endonuclease/exonuclease/phosphatase family protein [Winogradskyella sp. Asnod2-B02-A]|uniref:endonuclease/exonuclease/phosphatase family protein n=1 Tax=Winogradskyella sp. Asnod2-B02-A TaxID=3160583 RepID=UPI003869CBC9
MKIKYGKIDRLSIIVIIIVVIGVLSSFFDFGIISVFFSVIMPIVFIVNIVLAIYGALKKNYFYFIGIVLFFLNYNLFFQFSSNKELEIKDSISIVTYNVRGFKNHNSINSNQYDYTKIIKFIDSVDADILLLQESSYKEGKKIEQYPYVFLGYRENVNKSLLTIYSKYPIINKGYIDFKGTKNNAIYADLKVKQDTLRIYNCHLQSYVISPNTLTNKFNHNWNSLNNTISIQVEQANLIKKHAETFGENTIICGDFNATPYSQTYKVLKKGLKDSYLSKGSGFGKTYSFHNYPLRLDYFLYNDQLEVLSQNNFSLKLSDHEPIYMRFKIKQ